ncbi:protein EDS1-like [Arachis stenosperma]|uniref:protein EDS1-like n=1 Tax=Arachis stenosperma TaxID=217475 RepID=UPI0025AC07FF|nr:protein EDS1-like [Arachis stenosperma]
MAAAVGITEFIGAEMIEKAISLAWKAHKTPEKPFILEKNRKGDPQQVFISFPASGSAKDWYSQKPFGEVPIDLDLFPSLKSIGYNDAAKVNEAFQGRFQAILSKPLLETEVKDAMDKKRQIVFTGHSSGSPMAILATLWTLEKYPSTKSNGSVPPICVTFGSPLIGNHIFSHATRRENWSNFFMHFVMRYDIVPRILLSPLSSFDQRFEAVSQFFNPNHKLKSFMSESVGRSSHTSDFFSVVMSNAAKVTSHAVSKLIGTPDSTLEIIANFVPLSPYRPFGTYIFCTGNGKHVVIRNPDAVLQILFFSAQLSTEAEVAQVGSRSLQEHRTKLQLNFGKENFVFLEQDQLEKVPLTDDGSKDDISMAFNDLGLSPRARLCLRAAAGLEKQRLKNEERMKEKIDSDEFEEKMKELEKYKQVMELKNICYYDAFKKQESSEDFQANVKRLQLAMLWDEIMEKLRSYELPDEFEGRAEWVEHAKRFRRLVEPLDVANYYRHLRQIEAGTYMRKGRPVRYKFTQRWLEHAEGCKFEEEYSESCFWAEVEDLSHITNNATSIVNGSFDKDVLDRTQQRVARLVARIDVWIDNKVLDKDVLLEGSTLMNWWNSLPSQYRNGSSIKSLVKCKETR